jgi:hypothetical protein
MTAAALKTRQGLVQLWIVQIVGTLVLLGVVMAFARSGEFRLGTIPEEWKRYAIFAVLVAGAPAILYLRHYKQLLDYDAALERQRGSPDPAARAVLTKALVVGGAMCELPMAVGVIQLLLGGETRWFLGGTMIAIALRLSYRPFTRNA